MTSPSLNQASYYLLYHTSQNHKGQSCCSSAAQVGVVVPHEHQEEEEEQTTTSTTFWEDFEWTLQERDKAKEILKENFIKSSIHSNHVKGRSKFVVDQLDKEAHCHWDQFYSCVSLYVCVTFLYWSGWSFLL
jgi:hypothetical protein